MKYMTFKDFVREAHHAAFDHIDLEYEAIDDNCSSGHARWRTIVRSITSQGPQYAEGLMLSLIKWVRISGVITYLPTEEACKEAYSLDAIDRG